MRAAKSLKPEVPRPVSSPSSPDDLWPEPSSALFISWRPAREGAGAPLPSCQPRSWLEWLGLNQAARVLRLRHCSPPEVPGDSRTGSAQTLLVILEADQLSPNSQPPACFLFCFHEREVAVIPFTPAGTQIPASLGDKGTRRDTPRRGQEHGRRLSFCRIEGLSALK